MSSTNPDVFESSKDLRTALRSKDSAAIKEAFDSRASSLNNDDLEWIITALIIRDEHESYSGLDTPSETFLHNLIETYQLRGLQPCDIESEFKDFKLNFSDIQITTRKTVEDYPELFPDLLTHQKLEEDPRFKVAKNLVEMANFVLGIGRRNSAGGPSSEQIVATSSNSSPQGAPEQQITAAV